jgi:hypothetical protein
VAGVAVTTSRLPALIDYLVNAFQNAATLGGPVVSGTQTGPVTVFDGPPVTAAPAPLALYVGVDDVFTDTAPTSATADQTWAPGLSAQKRQETITVNCCAVAWAGTDDARTVRTQAFGILAAVEDLVRADTTYFGGNAGLADPGVSGIALQQSISEGTTAQVAFGITFRSFIGA